METLEVELHARQAHEGDFGVRFLEPLEERRRLPEDLWLGVGEDLSSPQGEARVVTEE